MSTPHVDTSRHPILDAAYAERCRIRLDADGALVLDGFFTDDAMESAPRERDAFYADSVTPTVGSTTRMLVVFAFNDQPGVRLSESALLTFYGRTS